MDLSNLLEYNLLKQNLSGTNQKQNIKLLETINKIVNHHKKLCNVEEYITNANMWSCPSCAHWHDCNQVSGKCDYTNTIMKLEKLKEPSNGP